MAEGKTAARNVRCQATKLHRDASPLVGSYAKTATNLSERAEGLVSLLHPLLSNLLILVAASFAVGGGLGMKTTAVAQESSRL
jgi:hypothetical protein